MLSKTKTIYQAFNKQKNINTVRQDCRLRIRVNSKTARFDVESAHRILTKRFISEKVERVSKI